MVGEGGTHRQRLASTPLQLHACEASGPLLQAQIRPCLVHHREIRLQEPLSLVAPLPREFSAFMAQKPPPLSPWEVTFRKSPELGSPGGVC